MPTSRPTREQLADAVQAALDTDRSSAEGIRNGGGADLPLGLADVFDRYAEAHEALLQVLGELEPGAPVPADLADRYTGWIAVDEIG
ncbi:hypothetical protein [Angustibacter aerolatus]